MALTCESCLSPVEPGDAFCGGCGRPVAAQLPVVPAGAAQWAVGNDERKQWPGRPEPGGGAFTGAALGQAMPNATYLGQRLMYERVPEETFDPLMNPRFLFHLLRQAVTYGLVWLSVQVLAGILLLLLVVGGISLSAVQIWTGLGSLIAFAAVCLFWLLPVSALLCEWKFLVDGKAAAGPVAFEHIIYALRRRQTPLEVMQVRRLRLAGGEARDYLELRRGVFVGLISCFSYGGDLYVGWTFWLNLSPARWLFMLVARIGQRLAHRGTDLYVTLRYESAKAMREVMHSAVREGIDVAAGLVTPQGQGIRESIPLAVTEITS